MTVTERKPDDHGREAIRTVCGLPTKPIRYDTYEGKRKQDTS